ncbi:MAG: helix-turn-helix transcriptional regulator [Bacteroidetes bacterium]|nr:helix-turn-helix transcriptional regulator [Bacteroidota bacterium]
MSEANLITLLGEEKLEIAGELVKAIGHADRLSIIDLLRNNKDITVTEITQLLNLHQSVISQHLILMRRRGVLKRKKVGKESHYTIASPEIEQVLDIIIAVAKKL